MKNDCFLSSWSISCLLRPTCLGGEASWREKWGQLVGRGNWAWPKPPPIRYVRMSHTALTADFRKMKTDDNGKTCGDRGATLQHTTHEYPHLPQVWCKYGARTKRIVDERTVTSQDASFQYFFSVVQSWEWSLFTLPPQATALPIIINRRHLRIPQHKQKAQLQWKKQWENLLFPSIWKHRPRFTRNCWKSLLPPSLNQYLNTMMRLSSLTMGGIYLQWY